MFPDDLGRDVLFWSAVVAAPFIGSFLGVIYHRLPATRSVTFGRSRCDNCHAVIRLHDLVPIAGWLALAGRCRDCRAPITPLYPALEVGALVIAVWASVTMPPDLVLPTCLLGWTLLALGVIDARDGILPDVLTMPLLFAGLLIGATFGQAGAFGHLAGAVLAGAGLMLVALVYRRLRGRDGLGLGDAKLFAAGGAWLGWTALPGVLLIAALSALAVGLARLPRSEWRADRELAFGPHLALGTWLVWLYGPIELVN